MIIVFFQKKRSRRESLGARCIFSPKNKLHLNKSSVERNKIYEGLVGSCADHQFLSILEKLPFGEPRRAESYESHEQPSGNSFRLLGSSGCAAPPEKLSCFYRMNNELCNQSGFLFSLKN